MNVRVVRIPGGILAALVGIAAFLVAGAGSARAATMVKTHGMMLDSVAVSVASDLLRGTQNDRAVVLLVPIPGDSMGLLAQRLLERLRAEGRDVRLRERALLPVGSTPPTLPPGWGSSTPASDSVPPPGPPPLELRARVDGLSVAYVRRIRSFPFGVKGYERLVSMRASATFVDPRTDAVLWAKSASGSLRDEVPKRDVAYAGGGAGFNPALPQGSGFRLLEPVIVVGVVAGLVVLFYSNRN